MYGSKRFSSGGTLAPKLDPQRVVSKDHPVTKMYVKGGRGGVCNIHFTVVHFFYWGILAYNFQRGGGHFFE